MLNKLKEFFPIPLIIFGGVMADVFRHVDIRTIEVISWTSIAVGVIGTARIVWFKVRNPYENDETDM